MQGNPTFFDVFFAYLVRLSFFAGFFGVYRKRKMLAVGE